MIWLGIALNLALMAACHMKYSVPDSGKFGIIVFDWEMGSVIIPL